MPNRADRRHVAVRAALLVLAAALLAPAAPAAELVNRVVIRVNDRIATLHDYQRRVAELDRELARREGLTLAQRRELVNNLPEDVFNTLFQEQLLLSRADQLGIVYTEEEVDAQIQRIREGYGVGSDEQFEELLAQQSMTLRDFRDQVRTGMRIQELLGREVRSQLDVGEELARVYYRDNPEQFMTPRRLYLREMVVLDDSALSEAERLELARGLRSELMAGRAIEELAEEYREVGTTSGAIDLGWVVGGDLARELQDAVWDLQPLDVSEPVAGRGGLHVIQVVERQEEGLRPFNDVAQEAEARATNVAMAESMEGYMKKLERQSYVVLDPPPEAADFRRATGEPLEDLPAVAPSDVTVAGGEAGAPAAEVGAQGAAAEAMEEAAAGDDGAAAPVPAPPSEPPAAAEEGGGR